MISSDSRIDQSQRPGGKRRATTAYLTGGAVLEPMGILVTKSGLFLASFAPLFLILGIRFQNKGLSVGCYLIASAGFAFAAIIFRRASAGQGASYRITAVEDKGPDVAGYLATYLLPFVTVAEPGWRDVAGYAVFFLTAFLIYIQSDMLQINPVLYVLGRRVAAVTVGGQARWYIITRGPVARDSDVSAVQFFGGVLIQTAGPG